MIQEFLHCQWHCQYKKTKQKQKQSETISIIESFDSIFWIIQIKATYKWKVSLYFGDQVFDLDLVANLRFLSARCGPIKFVSTNALNIPDWTGHFRSLAATTVWIELNWIFLKLILLTRQTNRQRNKQSIEFPINNSNNSNHSNRSGYGHVPREMKYLWRWLCARRIPDA